MKIDDFSSSQWYSGNPTVSLTAFLILSGIKPGYGQ